MGKKNPCSSLIIKTKTFPSSMRRNILSTSMYPRVTFRLIFSSNYQNSSVEFKKSHKVPELAPAPSTSTPDRTTHYLPQYPRPKLADNSNPRRSGPGYLSPILDSDDDDAANVSVQHLPDIHPSPLLPLRAMRTLRTAPPRAGSRLGSFPPPHRILPSRRIASGSRADRRQLQMTKIVLTHRLARGAPRYV